MDKEVFCVVVKYAVDTVEETNVSNYFPPMSESLTLVWPMFILLTEILRKVGCSPDLGRPNALYH